MKDSIPLMILLQVALIALNAIFACAEIAVISINDAKLDKLASTGDKRALRLTRLTSQPARFLATIQVAITLSGFLGSAFAADNFSDGIVSWLIKIGVSIPKETLDTIAVILITMVLSYFTLVFGELVPKQIAMRKAERLALGMSGLVSVIARFFAPIVWFLTKSTNGMLRLCGIDPNIQDDKVSEEEIRMMVDVGSESGTIDLSEKEFIHNIFEFDDLTAGEISTHRIEVSLLWMEESMDNWEFTIHNSRHTRYPVCQGSVDHIIGILNAKEYFRLKDKSRENVMENAVRAPYFVPKSVKADVLFGNMKRTHNSMAVVLDEYGGVTGIVTMNDLLQQLVGDFEEEELTDEKESVIEPIDSKTWKVPGSASIDEVSKVLGRNLPSDNYDTFNGFIFDVLGNIPKDGAQFDFTTAGLHIKVTEVRDHKIRTAVVCLVDSVDIAEEA